MQYSPTECCDQPPVGRSRDRWDLETGTGTKESDDAESMEERKRSQSNKAGLEKVGLKVNP